jgi:hypothetical protein
MGSFHCGEVWPMHRRKVGPQQVYIRGELSNLLFIQVKAASQAEVDHKKLKTGGEKSAICANILHCALRSSLI